MEVYRPQLAALDTLQHRLTRNAQCLHCGPHCEPAGWRLVSEECPQFFSEPDLPRSPRSELHARNEAILEPTVQGRWRYTQLTGGIRHRHQLTIRWIGRRLVTWNVPIRTHTSNGYRRESLAACGPPALAVKDARDHRVRIMNRKSPEER